MSNRKQIISELVKQSKENSDARLGSRMLEISGRIVPTESVLLPIDELKFNIRNGRFAAELIETEASLGRRLDPLNPQDASKICELLLDQESDKTESLKVDIEQNGQLEPGIITDEGFVINGNKRMAILEFLRAHTGEARYDKMEVMVLPPNTSSVDLWRIEAGLQLSDEKRIAYGPINELLKIEEATHLKLSHKQIAQAIYGLKPSDIAERLEWLELVKQYLKFVGKGNHYKEIENRFEHIKSANNTLRTLRKNGTSPAEITEYLSIIFEAIRVGATNNEVRKIGSAKVEGHKKAYSALRNALRDKKLTEELVEDAVDLIKSEIDAKKPQKLVQKIIDLLEILSVVEDSCLVNKISDGMLEEAKERIEKLKYRRTKASAETKLMIDKLKTKHKS